MESDESLFIRLTQGDLAAFDELYRRHARPLLGFIRIRLGDASEAEDVLHETFLALLRERSKASTVRAFKPWIYQVANHLCLNRSRSKQRATRTREAAFQEGVTGAVAASAIENRSDRIARLNEAIATLPEGLAAVFRLRASGLSYEEMANLLGVPLGTIKSRLHEVIQRLQKELVR